MLTQTNNALSQAEKELNGLGTPPPEPENLNVALKTMLDVSYSTLCVTFKNSKWSRADICIGY